MYKNQLQELAQRSCFNLPSYRCIREGPDHAPRFRACVNFNGDIFESPTYCPTLRQAEHAAAQLALSVLSSMSLTARVLDETGMYKNLLQETAHRAGLKLPVYTTVRSGPCHVPIFTCTVELAGMSFTGEPAKTKKQAEKNAAIAAWSALKTMPELGSLTNKEAYSQEQNQVQMQSQARRRMVRGILVHQHKDMSYGYSSMSANSPLLEQHEQWRLGGNSDLIKNTIIEKGCSSSTSNVYGSSSSPIYKPFLLKQLSASSMVDKSCSQSDQNTQMRNRMIGFQPPIGPPVKATALRRMAPAVQIRSVIPVCAAPIRPPPPPSSTTTLNPSSTLTKDSALASTGVQVSVSKWDSNRPQAQEQASSHSYTELSSSKFSSKLEL